MLNVPYHSQEDQDAKHFSHDCGAACASMILEWAGKGRMSVDELAAQTPLVRDPSGLAPIAILKLLKDHDLEAEARTGVTLDAIQAELLQNQRPVIALVRYGEIPERQNLPDKLGAHYVVVVGVDGDTVYLNDPDFWGSQMERGRGLAVKKSEFTSALAKSVIPGGVIFLKSPANAARPAQPSGAPTSAAPTKPAQPVQPTTATRQIPPGPAHVASDGLWLRSDPAGDQITMLNYLENVVVQPDAPVQARLNDADRVWVKVRTASGDGWCAEDGLAPGGPR